MKMSDFSLPWKFEQRQHRKVIVNTKGNVVADTFYKEADVEYPLIVHAVNNHDRLVRIKAIAKQIVTVLECADSGKPLTSNQGQALDGISERAEYRAIANQLKAELEEKDEC